MSQEGTTKGDPLVMPRYSVTKSVLINSLRMWLPTVKQVWLADDSAGAGRIKVLYDWYNHLGKEGKGMAVMSTEQKSGYKVPGAGV